jgi:hypothetical protein
MYIGRVMFPSFLTDFNKFEFPQHIIANTDIEFHENPFSGSLQTRDSLILAFGNFAKAPQQTVVNSVIAVNEFVSFSSLHSFVSKTSCETVNSRSPLSNSCGLQVGNHCSSWMRLFHYKCLAT